MGWAKYTEDNIKIAEQNGYENYQTFGMPIQKIKDTSTKYDSAHFEKTHQHIFLEVNHYRLNGREGTFSKITSIKLYEFGAKPLTIRLVVDSGEATQREYTIHTNNRQSVYDLYSLVGNRYFASLQINVGDFSFLIHQKIHLAELSIKDVKSGKYSSSIFDDTISEAHLNETEYLRYLQLLLTENASQYDVISNYLEFLEDEQKTHRSRWEKIAWYSFLITNDTNTLEKIGFSKDLIRAIQSIFNGSYDSALDILKDILKNEKNSDILHGCYLICSLLKHTSFNENYWREPFSKDGILGILLRIVEGLSAYSPQHPIFPSYDDLEELKFFIHLPLFRAVIHLVDAFREEQVLDIDDYRIVSFLTPWATVAFCRGKHQIEISNLIQNALNIFSENNEFKKYIQMRGTISLADYFTPKDGELYENELKLANSKRHQPYPASIFVSASQDDEIKLLPLGDVKAIGASCYMLVYHGFHILLDCGINPNKSGEDAYPHLNDLNCSIDAILISHAHLDHSGAVPKAHVLWPEAKIYATNITKFYLQYLYADMAKMTVSIDGCFDTENISGNWSEMKDTLQNIEWVSYGTKVKLNDSISFQFHVAGHLPGAAMIEVKVGTKTIIYTGDWADYEQSIMSSAYISKLSRNPDFILCESTYLSFSTLKWNDRKTDLEHAILKGIHNGESVLLPSNALGRSQEIACILGEMKLSGEIPSNVSLWIAGMAANVTNQMKCFMNEQFSKILDQYRIFDGSEYPSKASIVIASSGTLSERSAANKIFHHWASKGIPRRIITNGSFLPSKLFSNEKIVSCPLPTHASCTAITQMIQTLCPKTVAFIHQGASENNRSLLLDKLQYTVSEKTKWNTVVFNLEDNQLIKPCDLLYMMQKGFCYDA